jgi:hypothetical protein
MRIARGLLGQRIGAGPLLVLAALVVSATMLLVGAVGQTHAQESAAWQAMGPAGKQLDRLYTPTSGALLASGPDGLIRSDDGGLTWSTIERPADTKVVTVSPTDHQLLYAAGPGGVFRSEDGGDGWQQVVVQGDEWVVLEISPVDPALLYGVAIVRTPVGIDTNRAVEFRVSRDAGATWEVVRTQNERVVSGSQPCFYTVNRLQPHGVSTARVLTIEGCTGRGQDPLAGLSPDDGRTVALFPELRNPTWGANAAVGGTGVKPERWYVSLFGHGIPNGNSRRSKIMRTDDDGTSWTTVLDAAEWPSTTVPKVPIDFSTTLTYDPRRPDDVYAAFQKYEPDPASASSSAPSKAAGVVVRMSRDAGATWADLGGGDLPIPTSLAVGVDGRYLFAATAQGVYRAALSR